MGKYKMIQLTNGTIDAVEANSLIPLGVVTRKIACGNTNDTFEVASSKADTIILNEAGYYKITYTLTFVATNAGISNLSLLANSSVVNEVGATVLAGATVELSLTYFVRVYPQCNNASNNLPMTIQIQSNDAITSGIGNLIIEKLY